MKITIEGTEEEVARASEALARGYMMANAPNGGAHTQAPSEPQCTDGLGNRVALDGMDYIRE